MLGISSLIPLPALAKDVMNISVEQQSTYQVRGQVTDANKEPLIGVVVSVEDTKHPIRVTTDLDGMFSIDVPRGAHSIVFSYVGFKKHSERVSSSKVINVLMEEETNTFDEVVVTGYSSQKKLP